MRNNYSKSILATLLLLFCTVASAQKIQVDGICYNILSETDKTVEVTTNFPFYSGSVTIPSEVTYNNAKYSVTAIGEYAFRDCSSLSSVVIPNSVVTIGDYSFSRCI